MSCVWALGVLVTIAIGNSLWLLVPLLCFLASAIVAWDNNRYFSPKLWQYRLVWALSILGTISLLLALVFV